MYIIAEAGVNHNGSEELAMKLIEVAAKAGAHAVKFQTFKADRLVSRGTATAAYQQQQTGTLDQFDMLKDLELSETSYVRLFDHCKTLDIEFLSTPFDLESAQFLVDLGMEKIKVPSGEISNIPLIRGLAKYDLPIILSTGMAEMEEIQDAVSAIEDVRQESKMKQPLSEKLCLLHCTSNYPTNDENVNLKAITTMMKTFNLPIGYSDHTEGIVVSLAAAALGAVVLEKHFTIDRSLPGPDHKASIEPDTLKTLIDDAMRVSRCLGDGIKKPTDSEMEIKKLVRRSVVLNKSLSAGHCIIQGDIQLLRPGTGIAPKDIDKVIGAELAVDKKAGDLLEWEDLCK